MDYKLISLGCGALLSTGCLYQISAHTSHAPLDKIKDVKHKETAQLAVDAKQFTIDELGMPHTNHYTKYLPGELGNQTTKYSLYVSTKDTINDRRSPKIWIFHSHTVREPSLRYVIYESKVNNFEESKKELDELGYTTHIHATTQYTTPFLASQLTDELLEQGDVRIVTDVCHEQIHAALPNLWSLPMHESIAGYLDNLCAYNYFILREGDKSKNAERALDNYVDDKMKAKAISQGFDKLKILFKDTSKSHDEREKEREQILKEIENKSDIAFTNAFLAQKVVYYQNFDELERLYKANDNNIRATLADLRECPVTRKGCLRHIKRRTEVLEKITSSQK